MIENIALLRNSNNNVVNENTGGRSSSSPNGSNGSSGSAGGNGCPTCVAFSDQCCQMENGQDLFNEFIDVNLQCYWDAKFSEALSNLRYSGISLYGAIKHCFF